MVLLLVVLSVSYSCRPGAPGEPELDLTLQAPRSVQVGDTVVFTLHVSNPSDQEVTVRLATNDGRAFDPLVVREDGTEVWRNYHGLIMAVSGVLVLPPRGRTTYSATWDLRDLRGEPVPPGEYRVQGRLLYINGTPITAERPRRLRILPRQGPRS